MPSAAAVAAGGHRMMEIRMEKLLAKADSKYTIVVAAARRARQLMEDGRPLIKTESVQPVTVALEEIVEGKIVIERTKAGIK